jgi:hypothetical protein
VARGNTKFVKYFLEELDRVIGGPAAGSPSANTSILKKYDLPNVSQPLCLILARNIVLINILCRVEKNP